MPSKRKLVPAACAFKPDLILIGAGLDGMRNIVLGQFDITPQGLAAMTRVVVDLANELCQGRIVSVLEGGYRLDGLSDSVVAHVKTLGNSGDVDRIDLRSDAIGQRVTFIEASMVCEMTPDVDSSQRARVSRELGTVPILHEIIERK
jgi:acetoin utilization deacetylase AcuC-like enzyme